MENFLFKLDGRTPVLCEDVLEWAGKNVESRRVAVTQLPDCLISTVFIGINIHQQNPPAVFETAVFTDSGVDIPKRYSTWEEALAGHNETVLQYSEKG